MRHLIQLLLIAGLLTTAGNADARYLQPDPLGTVDGPNTYSYARQNPTRYTDPTGQCPWCLAAALGGGLGVGSGYLLDQFFGGQSYGWEEAALDFLGGAVGGGAGFCATGLRRAGTEFSHAIPARFFRNLPPNVRNLLDGRNSPLRRLNGNHVSPQFHAQTDPHRFLRGMTRANTRSAPVRAAARTPAWAAGGAAGGAVSQSFGFGDAN